MKNILHKIYIEFDSRWRLRMRGGGGLGKGMTGEKNKNYYKKIINTTIINKDIMKSININKKLIASMGTGALMVLMVFSMLFSGLPLDFLSIQKAEAAVTAGGNILYGDTTNPGTIKTILFTNPGTFGAEVAGAAASASNIVHLVTKTSPTRNEIMMGHLKVDGRLDIMTCTGSTGCDAVGEFTARWNNPGTTATQDCDSAPTIGTCVQSFDLGYESLSGNAMVVYTDTTAATVYYALWNGTAWSPNAAPGTPGVSNDISTNSGGAACAGTIRWVRVIPAGENLSDDRSNNVFLLVADSNNDLCAFFWDGTNWDTGTTLFTDLTNCDRARCFDGNWQGGRNFVASYTTAAANQIRYQKYLAGTGWTVTDTLAYTLASAGEWVSSAADPTSSRIYVTTTSAGNDTRGAVWRNDDATDGWTVCASGGCPDTAIETVVGNQASGVFERFNGEALHVFNNSGTTNTSTYMTYDGNVTWGAATSLGFASTDDLQSIRAIASANSDDIFIIIEDVDCDMDARMWNGGALQTISSNFELLASNTNNSCVNAAPVEGVGNGYSYDFAWRFYSPWARNWRFYSGTDTTATPTTALALENVAPTSFNGTNGKARLRYSVAELALGASQVGGRKKLQYTTDSPDSLDAVWTDVDNVAGAGAWRYADCDGGTTTCDDNIALSGTVLSGTPTVGWWTQDKDVDTGGTAMDHTAGQLRELEYSIEANGASANTTYYFRMYDLDQRTPVLREQDDDGSNDCATAVCTYPSIATAVAAPTVTTQAESNVTDTTVTVNGNITATGGSNVTVRGFAYGTSITLQTTIATTTDTAGQPFSTGAFTGSLTGLTCGTTYYSRPYATNSIGTGLGTIDSFVTSACPPVTLGDGTDGANSTIGPGALTAEIDRFSLKVGTGTDTVTGLTFTLGPANAYLNIATVDVQTTAGVSKCSTTPSSNTVLLTTCAIDVTTTPTDYKVIITSKSHAAMDAVPGASYDVVGTVTSVTAVGGTPAGTDTDSATITVDNLSPNEVSSLVAFGIAGATTSVATSNIANAIANDGTYMYVVGDDSSVNFQIEKRLISTGALDYSFGTNGVQLGAAASQKAYGVVIDDTYMYVAGYDSTPNARIEKRLLSTGALCDGVPCGGITFGTAGVATGPTASNVITGLAKDSAYLYSVGLNDSSQWYIEKRSAFNGGICDGAGGICGGTVFGTAGVVTGVATAASAIAIDSTYMYVAGFTATGWRIEKRLLSTGALETVSFGVSGIIDVGGTSNAAYAIDIDGTYMYVGGSDDSGNFRIEKRLLSTGAICDGVGGVCGGVVFGTSGIYSGPTASQVIRGMEIDSTYLYAVGYDTAAWRMEKRLLRDGSPDSNFGIAGVATSTSATTQGLAVNIDSTYMYVTGSTDAGDWMVEKRYLSNGALVTNSNPPNVAAGDTSATLTWDIPADADFHSTIVLRRATSAVADVPVEGAVYIVGNIIGTATVACVVDTPTATCSDSGLVNGTAYHYEIFAKDSRGNYSALGKVPSGSPVTPAPLATVTTQSASSITAITATLNGNITAITGTASARGFAWGTSATLNAETATTTENGSFSTGAFTSVGAITGLACETTYYVRAYATNVVGPGFGSIVPFTTASCASLTQSSYQVFNNPLSATGFGINGATTTSVTSYDGDIAVDSTYIYEFGEDVGSDDWRVEKRLLSDGSYDLSFGTNGVLYPSIDTNSAGAIAIDSTYMYLFGNVVGSWRVEKRLLTTGALCDGAGGVCGGVVFGTAGVVTAAAASGIAQSIAIDSTHMYLGGNDDTSDARIEKRLLSDGSLVNGFGTNGVVTGNTTSQNVYSIKVDSTYLYTAGYNAADGILEKRLLTTGAVDNGFGTSGQIVQNGAWYFNDAVIDSTYMYVLGQDSSANYLRLEKRLLTTGALCDGAGGVCGGVVFGTAGVVVDQYSTHGFSIEKDSTYLYAFNSSKVQKRLLSVGSLVNGFGVNGSTTLSSFTTVSIKTAKDSAYLYLAGNTSGTKVKLEKRYLEDGNLKAGTDVGTAIATQDSMATLTAAGDSFRVRVLNTVASTDLLLSGVNYKLQFGEKAGTCAAATFADVTNASVIAWQTAGGTDGSALTGTDGMTSANTINPQTYVRKSGGATPFTNSVSAIPVGQDGKWDFALFDNGATAGATYCFRIIKDSGSTAGWSWTSYPEVKMYAVPGQATISSASNQSFSTGTFVVPMSEITITDGLTPTITAANDLRIAIATSSVNMRWNVNNTTAIIGGSASGKVSSTVSYEGGGSVLVIPVNTNFSASQTLTISGLSFTNFGDVSVPVSSLDLYLGGAGDITSDADDDKTIAIKGILLISPHDAGQEMNKFDITSYSVTDAELFAFKLVPLGENFTISNLVLNLNGVRGVGPGDVTNPKLYIDYDANGSIDANDLQVGGLASVFIMGQNGTLVFGSPFTATTTRNYILKADVTQIYPYDGFNVNLTQTGVTSSGVVSGQSAVFGSLIDFINHVKLGSGTTAVGGDTTATQSTNTGGGTGGGESLGDEPGFLIPTGVGTNDQWLTASNVYDRVDGTYATETVAGEAEDYKDFSFSIPANSIIDGIQVKIEASGSTAAGTIQVALSWNGGTNITAVKTTATLGTADSIYTLGNPFDKWGRTWTTANLSNANFRVRLVGQPSNNTVKVDAIQAKIFFHAGGGSSGGGDIIKTDSKSNVANVFSVFDYLAKIFNKYILNR